MCQELRRRRNRVVQCHIITESPVTDPAAPGLFFHFGLDFTASLLSEEELEHEAALSCSHQNQTERWPRQPLVSLAQLRFHILSSCEEKHKELLTVLRFSEHLCQALQNICQSLKGLCTGN